MAIGHPRDDHGAMRVRSNVSYNSSRSASNSPASATSSPRATPEHLDRPSDDGRDPFPLDPLIEQIGRLPEHRDLVTATCGRTLGEPLRRGLPADAEHLTELCRRDVPQAYGPLQRAGVQLVVEPIDDPPEHVGVAAGSQHHFSRYDVGDRHTVTLSQPFVNRNQLSTGQA